MKNRNRYTQHGGSMRRSSGEIRSECMRVWDLREESENQVNRFNGGGDPRMGKMVIGSTDLLGQDDRKILNDEIRSTRLMSRDDREMTNSENKSTR